MRVDVLNNRRLQATLLALRTVDKDVRQHVRQVTRGALAPDFTKQMNERTAQSSQARLQNAVLGRTARIAVSDQNIKMSSAASTRRLKGGLQPSVHGKAIEFGSNQNKDTRYQRRSVKGKVHTVTRNAQAQMPRRRRGGWAFYPSVNDLAPRFLSLWVQTAVRTVHEAWEAKR